MASPEVYQSLSRGTLDGGVWAFTTVVSYDWGGLVKYATIGENFGSFLVTYMIGESKWKQLSPGIQKAMIEAGEATTRRHCNQVEQDELLDIEKLRKQGVTIIELPKEAKETIAKNISSVADEWAQTMDKRGKPGSEVLKAYIDAVKQAK
jgi:TRAP-type C4-dicarboxylate transport system substrate-binding protein